MNDLKKWALIAEVLGGLGIIVSIIYLAAEMSRNSANTEVNNHLEIIGQIQDLRALAIEDKEFADIRIRGDAGLSNLDDIERLRYSNWAFNSLDLWESTLVMYQRGGTSEESWNVYNSGWCSFFQNAPGMQEVLSELQGSAFTTDFAENVKSCLNQ
jgi:hypothetical protein